MMPRYAYLLLTACLAASAVAPARLEAQEREPYTIDDLVQLLESGVFSESRVKTLVERSCIGFRLDDAAVRRLSAADASTGLIADLREVCVRLPHVVETVVVTPAELDMAVGASRILRAQALAPDSTQMSGVVFEWASEDTAVAEVSGGGMVMAKARGEVRITARTQEGPTGAALVRVGGAGAAGVDEAAAEPVPGAKSVGTAAALGVVVPGGGEFYTGNSAKGVAVLVGSAGALAAGFLITSSELDSVSYRAETAASCAPEGTPCDYDVTRFENSTETNNLLIGAAAAGALWVYGLVDGIRAAKKSQVAPAQEEESPSSGLSLEILPADGIRYTALGEVEFTFIRVRS